MNFDHQEDERMFIAKKMVMADIKEMGEIDFMEQCPSDIANSFMHVCVESSQDQLEEIFAIREAEIQLDELGLGEEQTRVNIDNVVRACHNNFSTGMACLACYLEIFESIKEQYEL